MSKDQVKELAKQFMQEQSRILKDHGDKVVQSKYKDAVNSVQKTFELICEKSKIKRAGA